MPNNEPRATAATDGDLDLGEEIRVDADVALAVDEVMIGTCEVEDGDREDDVEELMFVVFDVLVVYMSPSTIAYG